MKYKKKYKMEPLNLEIKKLEAKIYKHNYKDDSELSHLESVLFGMYLAKKAITSEICDCDVPKEQHCKHN